MSAKKLELLFDAVSYLYQGADGNFKFTDAKGVEKTAEPKQVQAFVGNKVHEYMLSGYSVVDGDNGKIAIQAFAGSTDLTKIDTNVWNAFQETPNHDMFWQEAFRTVPLRKGQLDWSIGTVTNGIALEILEEGKKVRYASISGTTVKGSVDLYGSGLMLSWKTIEGRDLAGFFNAMLEFKNKRMKEYADQHYGLLAAGASVNSAIDYQLTSDSAQLDRDIATLNEAYNTIGEANKDKGYGDTANTVMILYVSPRLKSRLNQALRVTSADMARSGGPGQVTVDANIVIRYTYNSAIAANKGLMVLPKYKTQNAVYMEDKSFEREDPDNLNWLKSSFTAFGGLVGDTDQMRTVDFAD